MHDHTTGRLLAVVLWTGWILLAALQTGCSSSPEELSSCPRGDAAWKAALDGARSEDTVDRLLASAEAATALCPERWEPLWTVGECLFTKWQTDRSKELLQRLEQVLQEGLDRAEALEDPVGVARTANRLAYAYKKKPDPDGAERLYRKALAAAVTAGHEELEAKINNNLAGMLMRSGQLAEAMAAFGAAETGLEKLGLTAAAHTATYNKALLLETLGQLFAARETLERLYPQALKAGDSRSLANICVVLGNLHLLLDERDAARSWYGKVPDDQALPRARAELGLGRLAMRDGSYDEAARLLDGVGAQELDADLALLARTLRAEAELRSGRSEGARQRLAGIVGEADRDGQKLIAWMARTLWGKALLDSADGTAEAARHFRQAMEAVEARGEGLQHGEEGLAYLRERSEPYAELAAALTALHGEDEAEAILRVVELAHARTLRQLMGGGAEARVEIAGLALLQKALEPGEVLLDFLIGEDRGVVVAVTPRHVQVERLPGWRTLRAPLRQYVSALKRPLISRAARSGPEEDLRRDIEPGKQLRRTLLGPLEELLEPAQRIYVVPDQDLALLPLSALPLETSGSSTHAGPLEFLGDVKEIALLPMAGVPPSWSESRATILLAGDPLPDRSGEFEALPFAEAELANVRTIWREGTTTLLRRRDLTADRLRGLPLETFDILHFATHAVASSSDPRRCAVILSRGEKLGMREIADLSLGAPLVVLSACRTGAGEVIPGEGVVGLAWAFLRAGAQGIAASLWSVEDDSTAALMVGFHRNLRADPDPVRALSRAQRELAATRRHPAYWAPFVVIVSPRR